MRMSANFKRKVVVTALVDLVILQNLDTDADGGPVTMLRTLRVLRPLRSFSRLKGLRNIINTFLVSMLGMSSNLGFAVYTHRTLNYFTWQGP